MTAEPPNSSPTTEPATLPTAWRPGAMWRAGAVWLGSLAPANMPLKGRPFAAQLRSTALDLIIVLGLAIAAAKLSGSEKWTTSYTPDSEFYLTLGVFGDQVTDRAPQPSYFWTKLGIIGPTRVLFSAFGVGAGWTIYRVILLAIIIASIYFVVRWCGRSRFAGSLISMVAALNTAVIFWVGNTYFAGGALAAMLLTFALATGVWLRRGTSAPLLGVALGGAISWSVMINPYSAAMAIVVGGLVLLAGLRAWADLRRLGVVVAFGTIGLLAGLGLFFTAAQVLFPRLNWLETVVGATTGIDFVQYSSPDPFGWMSTYTSLLVPLGAIVTSIVMLVRSPRSPRSRIAIAASLSNVVFAFVWAAIQGGVTVEAPYYGVLLWPAALLAYALFLSEVDIPAPRWLALVLSVSTFALMSVIAHLDILVTDPDGPLPELPVALVSIALLATAIVAVVRRRRDRWWSLALVVVTIYCSAVVAQNLQPQVEQGFSRLPYTRAFVDNAEHVNVERNLAVESWVLATTTDDDTIFTWVEPETYVTPPAAMQLYGPNSMATGWTLGEWEIANLNNHRPTILVSYMFSPTAVDRIQEAMSDAGFHAEVIGCSDYPPYTFEGPNLHVCASRVTYPNPAEG